MCDYVGVYTRGILVQWISDSSQWFPVTIIYFFSTHRTVITCTSSEQVLIGEISMCIHLHAMKHNPTNNSNKNMKST